MTTSDQDAAANPANNPLIKRLLTVFPLPKHASADDARKVFLEEYAALTKGYGGQSLSLAADLLIRQSDERSWPTPREVVVACAEALENIAAKSASANAGKPKQLMPWEANRDKARDWAEEFMRLNPLAQEAREEGWAEQLQRYAESYALLGLNGNHTLAATKNWRPNHEAITDYRKAAARGRVQKEGHA